MDAQHIRGELLKKGLNFSKIANMLEVSANAVSKVAKRERTSHRIAVAIATALDVDVSTVFPETPSYHRPYMDSSEKQKVTLKLDSRFRSLKLTAVG